MKAKALQYRTQKIHFDMHAENSCSNFTSIKSIQTDSVQR